VADFIEPRMHTLNVLILDVQKLPRANGRTPAYSSADNVLQWIPQRCRQCAGNRWIKRDALFQEPQLASKNSSAPQADDTQN